MDGGRVAIDARRRRVRRVGGVGLPSDSVQLPYAVGSSTANHQSPLEVRQENGRSNGSIGTGNDLASIGSPSNNAVAGDGLNGTVVLESENISYRSDWEPPE